MIPYDDLVAALAGWRAKQGLSSGASGSMPAASASGSMAAASSGPMAAAAPVAAQPATASAGSGPKRGGPPAAPQPSGAKPGSGRTAAPAPAPLPPPSETLDIEDHETLSVEEHAVEPDEFNSAFGSLTADAHDDGESTAIGAAPTSINAGPGSGGRGGRNDW